MSAALLDTALRGTVGLAGAAMLVLAVATLLARRAAVAVGLVATQAACLAVALLAEAWLQASWSLAAVAVFTIAAKAIAPPLGLRAVSHALAEAPARSLIGPAAAAVALAGLAVVAMPPTVDPAIAVALAVMLVGGLALARRDGGAIGPVIGVLVLENGLVLALAVAPGLPGAALLAIATAALPAAAVLVLMRRLLPERAGR